MNQQEQLIKLLANDKEEIERLKSLNFRKERPEMWTQLRLDFSGTFSKMYEKIDSRK